MLHVRVHLAYRVSTNLSSIGGTLGYIGNMYQDVLYRKNFAKRGVEARLYAPMASGIMFGLGSIIFGLASVPQAHWIGACIGIVILMSKCTDHLCRIATDPLQLVHSQSTRLDSYSGFRRVD